MPNLRGAGEGKKSDWETPLESFNPINDIINFKIDVAASESNTKCPLWIDEEMDAFKTEWEPAPWFLNYPWGKEYMKRSGRKPKDWVNRILNQVQKQNFGVLLTPASVNAKWFHLALSKADYVLFPHTRVKYEHPSREKPSSPNLESAWIFYIDRKLTSAEITKLGKLGALMEIIS
jgi:phage N-6-adenine-methyltransferase